MILASQTTSYIIPELLSYKENRFLPESLLIVKILWKIIFRWKFYHGLICVLRIYMLNLVNYWIELGSEIFTNEDLILLEFVFPFMSTYHKIVLTFYQILLRCLLIHWKDNFEIYMSDMDKFCWFWLYLYDMYSKNYIYETNHARIWFTESYDKELLDQLGAYGLFNRHSEKWVLCKYIKLKNHDMYIWILDLLYDDYYSAHYQWH